MGQDDRSFDADIFEKKVTNFQEVVALGEKENILAISNPSFELFYYCILKMHMRRIFCLIWMQL